MLSLGKQAWSFPAQRTEHKGVLLLECWRCFCTSDLVLLVPLAHLAWLGWEASQACVAGGKGMGAKGLSTKEIGKQIPKALSFHVASALHPGVERPRIETTLHSQCWFIHFLENPAWC